MTVFFGQSFFCLKTGYFSNAARTVRSPAFLGLALQRAIEKESPVGIIRRAIIFNRLFLKNKSTDYSRTLPSGIGTEIHRTGAFVCDLSSDDLPAKEIFALEPVAGSDRDANRFGATTSLKVLENVCKELSGSSTLVEPFAFLSRSRNESVLPVPGAGSIIGAAGSAESTGGISTAGSSIGGLFLICSPAGSNSKEGSSAAVPPMGRERKSSTGSGSTGRFRACESAGSSVRSGSSWRRRGARSNSS